MDLVVGAMGNLAPKLLQLLKGEYKLQKGLRAEVESLADELESAHGALCKVAQVPPNQLDPQVKLWARHVREASYDMEDILDTFLVRVDGGDHADKGKFERFLEKMGKLFNPSKLKARRDIASAIENIKKQVDEMARRRDRYKVDGIIVASLQVDPRLEAMYKEVTQLVGIKEPMGELISMLSLQKRDEVSNEKLKIVSIVGMGGLGKTTVARAVYDKLKSDFSCGAFVPVGRKPDLKKVLKNILVDLDRGSMYGDLSIFDEWQLIDRLRDFLETKRYFIIIDDVWEKQTWKTISLALPENMRGSRIISTTRNLEATSGEVYRLQPLSENMSKKLFYTRIFDGEGKCPDNQVDEMSNKILKKCGGIPLAIITMASLLVDKSMGEWSEVCNSTGFHDEDNEQVNMTNRILSLSYYDLPCYLRTCLLYLSAFPEDYTIDKNSLIWRWIAEGFVTEKADIGLFEVGEGYFNVLVNRSMIEAVESKLDGIINGCRVHDMVLDLLRSLSREENFVTVLLDNDEGTSSLSCARRLAHQKSTMDPHLENHKGIQKLRSLIAYGCDSDKLLSFQSFKLLRVMDLERVYLKSWHNAKYLGNLLHLRYLGLKYTNIPELPKEIGALEFLQTLDLLQNLDMDILPLSSQITQLVCLRVCAVRMLVRSLFWLPSCLNLYCLEMAVNHIDEQSMHVLGGLPELRHLVLSTCSMVIVTNIAIEGCFQKLRACRFPSSVVLFVLNEDSSVSFTLWNGSDDIVFSSAKNDECRRAPAVMPNLQELSFMVGNCTMGKCKFGNLGLEYLPSLKKVTVPISCLFSMSEEHVMEAEAALRDEIDVHPNHPTLILRRLHEKFAQQKWARQSAARDSNADLPNEEPEEVLVGN